MVEHVQRSKNIRCKCESCRALAAAGQRAVRKRRYLRDHGYKFPTDWVPATDARLMLKKMRIDRDMTQQEMARATGVARTAIQHIETGRCIDIQRATHDAIVRVYMGEERGLIPTSHVEVAEAMHIIRCLMAQGWPKAEQAKMLGWTARKIDGIRDGKKKIHYNKIVELQALAERLGDRRGPSDRVRQCTQTRGYFPFIHYDENRQLIVSSLTPELKAKWARVRSTHGSSRGRSDRA